MVENAKDRQLKEEKSMSIAVEFAPSRSKKIAVDVVPAEWQLYLVD
ncbi:MAG: hypothetical protein Q3996_00180 [Candidatus Saccharibacteria bacterium]|nr:hypothetical protein [Candidatus Saccharibacteria bacterium]